MGVRILLAAQISPDFYFFSVCMVLILANFPHLHHYMSKDTEAFMAIVKAGLWGNANDLPALQACDQSGANVNLNLFEGMDWGEVLRLAEEQSVVGLVNAGLEKSPTGFVPLTEKLTLLGKCQLIEQRNVAMNRIIDDLMMKLHETGIKAVLVKGQGVAQCYERPLWRASGDVDLLFDRKDYKRATEVFLPLASSHKRDERYSRHLGLTIDSWYIEIHGSLRTGLSSRVDKVVDEVQEDTFKYNRFRVWHNGKAEVLLPAQDNDVFFVFTHFIKHLYKEKMSLRQICDWCRLLWVYRNEIDSALLKKRLRKAGLIGEWKAFAALAVDALGMPVVAMPLYDAGMVWHKKGEFLLKFIMNNNRPNKQERTTSIAKIFPWNTTCFLPSILFNVNRLKVKERILGL